MLNKNLELGTKISSHVAKEWLIFDYTVGGYSSWCNITHSPMQAATMLYTSRSTGYIVFNMETMGGGCNENLLVVYLCLLLDVILLCFYAIKFINVYIFCLYIIHIFNSFIYRGSATFAALLRGAWKSDLNIPYANRLPTSLVKYKFVYFQNTTQTCTYSIIYIILTNTKVHIVCCSVYLY